MGLLTLLMFCAVCHLSTNNPILVLKVGGTYQVQLPTLHVQRFGLFLLSLCSFYSSDIATHKFNRSCSIFLSTILKIDCFSAAGQPHTFQYQLLLCYFLQSSQWIQSVNRQETNVSVVLESFQSTCELQHYIKPNRIVSPKAELTLNLTVLGLNQFTINQMIFYKFYGKLVQS